MKIELSFYKWVSKENEFLKGVEYENFKYGEISDEVLRFMK